MALPLRLKNGQNRSGSCTGPSLDQINRQTSRIFEGTAPLFPKEEAVSTTGAIQDTTHTGTRQGLTKLPKEAEEADNRTKGASGSCSIEQYSFTFKRTFQLYNSSKFKHAGTFNTRGVKSQSCDSRKSKTLLPQLGKNNPRPMGPTSSSRGHNRVCQFPTISGDSPSSTSMVRGGGSTNGKRDTLLTRERGSDNENHLCKDFLTNSFQALGFVFESPALRILGEGMSLKPVEFHIDAEHNTRSKAKSYKCTAGTTTIPRLDTMLSFDGDVWDAFHKFACY